MPREFLQYSLKNDEDWKVPGLEREGRADRDLLELECDDLTLDRLSMAFRENSSRAKLIPPVLIQVKKRTRK